MRKYLRHHIDKYKYQGVVIIVLLILAVICLIIGITAFVYDIKDARRKDKEAKAEKDHKALIESFKRLGMSDNEAEIAARGH